MSLTEAERRRVEALEAHLYGPPGEGDKGLLGRFQVTEAFVEEMREMNKKIIWLLVAGVLAAILNLVLHAPHLSE